MPPTPCIDAGATHRRQRRLPVYAAPSTVSSSPADPAPTAPDPTNPPCEASPLSTPLCPSPRTRRRAPPSRVLAAQCARSVAPAAAPTRCSSSPVLVHARPAGFALAAPCRRSPSVVQPCCCCSAKPARGRPRGRVPAPATTSAPCRWTLTSPAPEPLVAVRVPAPSTGLQDASAGAPRCLPRRGRPPVAPGGLAPPHLLRASAHPDRKSVV